MSVFLLRTPTGDANVPACSTPPGLSSAACQRPWRVRSSRRKAVTWPRVDVVSVTYYPLRNMSSADIACSASRNGRNPSHTCNAPNSDRGVRPISPLHPGHSSASYLTKHLPRLLQFRQEPQFSRPLYLPPWLASYSSTNFR